MLVDQETLYSSPKVRFFTIIVCLFLSSCSQFSKSPTSKAWHNMNAKYNALLLAKEDYKIAISTILESNKDNFETILPIFLKIDSSKLDSAKIFLEDAIKKSSIIAERHSNAKYLDEAYIILGKSRLFKEEFFNAIETFKYVNTTAKTNEAKNQALIWLMRAYIENEDMVSANQVSDILKKEKLSKINKGQFLITKAYFHQKLNQEAIAVVLLEEGLKSFPKSKEKARLHFIAGQLYDKLNKPILARKNYNSALKNRPYYDLEFNAKLGLIMNQSLAKNSILEFETMMTDRKNQDLLDKIFFKMGELESKKKNYDKAIEYFSKSVSKSENNLIQKAYSYKAIADIYFDSLLDYETASVYYDSTLITIPKDFEEYKNLSQRALSLNDFIRYKKALDLEDSLQVLAQLNPLELNFKLEKIITYKKNTQKKLEEAEVIKNNETAKQNTSNSILGEKKWLFYDQVELLKSKNEFIRVWGNRALEDNWRRNERETGSISFKVERNVKDSTSLKSASALQSVLDEKEAALKKEIELEVADLKQKIPLSQIQLIASKRKQEEAYFQLGKIYKLQFNDPEKAKRMFEILIEKYPRSMYEPEALYFLSIMSENSVDNQFAIILKEKYPYSSFSRLLKKGGVKLSKDKEADAQILYASIFKSFESKDYAKTLEMLDSGLNEFSGSQIEDKMALLRILTLSKMSSKESYLISLNDFIRSYPTSDLLIRAKQMLAVINK